MILSDILGGSYSISRLLFIISRIFFHNCSPAVTTFRASSLPAAGLLVLQYINQACILRIINAEFFMSE